MLAELKVGLTYVPAMLKDDVDGNWDISGFVF